MKHLKNAALLSGLTVAVIAETFVAAVVMIVTAPISIYNTVKLHFKENKING